ncbi:HU family DNA-binding protein, partial [Polaromonas jejuensis]|uniref:HU family DNA-binding protein n=1 Tax=Polaromonas jejuensis TaxID=457502 RepID=A0ABW0QCG8_9BURK
MNRIELIEKLISKNDLTKAAAGRILDTLIETIQVAVKKGDSVTLVGFVRIPLMADSDSTFIADSIPGDGGHPALVS